MNDDSASVDDYSRGYNASKLVLLIEPRPLPHLVPLILHMIAVVPPDWRFLVIGSSWSLYNIGRSSSIQQYAKLAKLDLLRLPKPWKLETSEDVSKLLTDLRFYDEFIPNVEWILLFQHDTILCANSQTSLDDWLDWGWAGCPL